MTSMPTSLAEVDPFDPVWRQNPWPLYARFRDESPVHRFPSGTWFVTRFDDCTAVLRDRRFGSDPARGNERAREQAGNVFQQDNPVLLFLDPPDHTRLRGLVSKAFTPRVVGAMRPEIEAIVARLLDGVVTSGHTDLVNDVAYPLPAEVICRLLGVPGDDLERFHEWSSAASRLLAGNLDDETRDAGIAATAELYAYFATLLDERRAAPRDDLVSRLIAVEEAGDRLAPDELLTLVVTLFVAGHETTMNLLGTGTLALLDHPHQMEMLREGTIPARAVVEEALRYDGPAQVASRITLEPVQIGGVDVEAGDWVLLGLAAANRDPRRFEHADRFDITRADAGHLAFSLGAHHCLGAALARLEAEVAFDAIARRLPELHLAGERPRYRAHATIRGLESLPVAFDARDAATRPARTASVSSPD